MTSFDDFARRVLPLVRAADDPDAVRHSAKLMFVNHHQLLLADALSRRPHDSALWKELLDKYDIHAMATFGPVRIADGKGALRDESKSFADSDVAALAARQVEGLSQLAMLFKFVFVRADGSKAS